MSDVEKYTSEFCKSRMIAGFWGMNMPVPGQSGYAFYETGWFWLVVFGAVILTAMIGVLLLRSRKCN